MTTTQLAELAALPVSLRKKLWLWLRRDNCTYELAARELAREGHSVSVVTINEFYRAAAGEAARLKAEAMQQADARFRTWLCGPARTTKKDAA